MRLFDLQFTGTRGHEFPAHVTHIELVPGEKQAKNPSIIHNIVINAKILLAAYLKK